MIAELESLSDFSETAFGRALLANIVLLLLLFALGAWNRQRARLVSERHMYLFRRSNDAQYDRSRSCA